MGTFLTPRKTILLERRGGPCFLGQKGEGGEGEGPSSNLHKRGGSRAGKKNIRLGESHPWPSEKREKKHIWGKKKSQMPGIEAGQHESVH